MAFYLKGVKLSHKKNTSPEKAEKISVSSVTIPMSMHIGRPANAVVKKGDNSLGTPIQQYISNETSRISWSADGKVLYKNPFGKARLTDEEIAIATCLVKMAEYVESGKEFYSVKQAALDAKTAFLFHNI